MIDFNEHEFQRSQLDLTSMMDVVFLLLIFFMLTSCYANPQLPVNLPKAETSTVQNQKSVSVTIKNDGTIYINENLISPENIYSTLCNVYGAEGTLKNLEINSDKDVSFGMVVQVLDQAKKAGAQNISVATEHN